MSKRLRNKGPSAEKIEKALQAYKIAKVLVDDIDLLIRNIVIKHPDTFLQAVKSLGIKDFSWQSLILWIDENYQKLEQQKAPTHLRPSKIQFIKLHRTITNLGLRESKEAIDAFFIEQGWNDNRWDEYWIRH